MLSLAGGIVGVLVAVAINRIVQRVDYPIDIALVFDLRIDWRVLSFTLGLSVLTGMLFSLIPALQSSKSSNAACASRLPTVPITPPWLPANRIAPSPFTRCTVIVETLRSHSRFPAAARRLR